ncbi:TPA: tail fiber domain-containing protein [Escherichia coli]
MATTPTNKPIPSEDPRDLKFNAGKIDEEVNGSADYYIDRFGAQRLTNTGRNNQFQDAQTQREYDFQQFLLNSGYQFLGDYENGPYTITARNQIIRYQNEFWRLNAATNPPYTTTGVNSTSWAVDVTHLVSVGDAALRQDYIHYITLEALGGGVNVADNGPALQEFFNGAKSGLYGELRLGPGLYPIITPAVASSPVSIVGMGCGNNTSTSKQFSGFKDNRVSAGSWIIELQNGSPSTVAFNLQDFAIVGTKGSKTKGLGIGFRSWQGKLESIRIQDYDKEGLGIIDHLNDTLFYDIKIINCGGKVDGNVYYAFDSYTYVDSGDSGMNQCMFYKLHIEYARYVMKFKGWLCNFNDCHFEEGSAETITSVDDSTHHWIDIMEVAYPVVFSKCNFVGPTYAHLIAGLTNTSDPVGTLSNFASVVGSSATTAGLADAVVKTEVKFTDCTFTNGTDTGTIRYLYFPIHNLSVSGCRFTRGTYTQYTRPIYSGSRLKVVDSEIFMTTPTADTSFIAAYVNNIAGPAVRGSNWARIQGNQFWHTNADTLSLTAYAVDGSNIFSTTFRSQISDNTLQGYTAIYDGSMVKTIAATSFTISKYGDLSPSSFFRATGSQAFVSSSEPSGVSALSIVSPSGGASNLVFNYGGSTFTQQYASGGYQQRFTSSVGVGFANDGTNIRFHPLVDATGYIGQPSFRFNTIYATNSTINTSDKRDKCNIRSISDAEVNAFYEIGQLDSVWQWIEKYQTEGDGARLHSGPTVQDAIEIMNKYGLDWSSYSAFCFDEWEEIPEVKREWPAEDAIYETIPASQAVIEDGIEISPSTPERTVLVKEAVDAGSEIEQLYSPAGSKYGFRKEELLFWITRATIAKQKNLEERISFLENK